MKPAQQYFAIQMAVVVLLLWVLSLAVVSVAFLLMGVHTVALLLVLMVAYMASKLMALQSDGLNRKFWSRVSTVPDKTLEDIHDELKDSGELEEWV